MKIFLFCLFAIVSTIVNAQIQYKFNHFTTDEGLPSNTIYSITEDKKGNLVFGTDNGLSVFDGNDFTNYNVKDGLINPYIVSVSNDIYGNILFINYNAKLQKLVGNRILDTNKKTTFFNDILSFSDKIYLSTSQRRNKNKTYSFKEITTKTKHKINPRIAPPILFQENEEIKVLENKIVYKNFKIPLTKNIKFIHKIIFRKNDIAVLDDDFLFIINFSGVILHQIKLPSNLSENAIYKNDLIIDHQENCWLNIQNIGLFVLENNSWKSVNNQMDLSAKENINFLFCDKRGKIWIATHDNGLFCFSTTLTQTIFSENGNYFTGLQTSFDKNTMLVSSPFILYEYKNKKLNFLEKYSAEVKLSSYNLYPVISNIKHQNFEFDTKIYKINAKQLLKTERNTFFATGLYGGMCVLVNGKESTIQTYPTEAERIRNVEKYNNEYYFNNSKTISIRTFNNTNVTIKETLNLNIKGFIQDFKFLNDTMYIATDGKVYKAFGKKIIDSISNTNNYEVENIRKIKIIDQQIFLCGNDGVIMLSQKGNRIINKYNFLNSNEVFDVAKLNDELFVASKKGLSKIDFSIIEKKSDKPLFSIYNNNVEAKKLTISSKLDLLKFVLKIQNFNAVRNQIIQYKIDNSSWNLSQTKNIYFQSLSYGQHEIYIRVKDVNSDWETKTIMVYKLFPFYLKWWFIVLATLFFAGLIYAIYRYQIKKIQAKKQQEIATNTKIVELRQNALSAMMNPHFVFNSLNAIQYFVNSNQKEQSSENLAKLARLVRLFLSQAAEPFISLSDEISRLKLYLELEQVRFMNFAFTVNIDEDIDIHQIKIPNMIVQPFIENAILHGVSHLTEKDGQIDLSFQLKQNILTIEVIDNGFGIDNDKLKSDTHISKGIAIITERIEILQQSYPEKIFSINQTNAFPDAIREGHKVVIMVTILN